jgi:hypothetical protein
MSNISLSEVLNMLNNSDSDSGSPDTDSFPTEFPEFRDNTNEETVPLNIFDSSTLPSSFLEELNGELIENQNICLVSENNIDVYVNLHDTNRNDTLDRVIFTSSQLNYEVQHKEVDKNTPLCSEDTDSDYNNNTIVNSKCVSNEKNHEFRQSSEDSSIEDEETHENDNISDNILEQAIVSENSSDRHENDSEVLDRQRHRGRKRIRDPSSWQKEIRKRRRQGGEEYTNTRGNLVPKKIMKLNKDCQSKCNRKCGHFFCRNDIENISRNFWSLSDCDKYSYFAQTTEKIEHTSKKANSRRKYTYKYYFLKDSEKVQVCKDFYLSVLQVSDKRIRNFYEKLEKCDGKQYTDMRGRNTKRRTDEQELNFIRNHIESFPRIPSHYCRSSTTKDYLEPDLSLEKMYDMYVENCHKYHLNPLKKSMYRTIFKEEFNIGFHVPKKDRCDLCEEFKKANTVDTVDDKLKEKYYTHEADKTHTKAERDSDRNDKTQVVVCFDLQNVTVLPKANVSNFYYKRKLCAYNLTAHLSSDGSAYNALWNEALSGRGANEIASAIVTILKDIKSKHPEIKSIVLWSDSCVPQNKNSVMCYALKRFMIDSNIDTIIQKFGCPGHSSIQEVDNIHSCIEKTLRPLEIFSPLSMIRNLRSTRRRNPFHIIQMQKHHFHDYKKAIFGLNFQGIPFSKVKCLKYTKTQPMLVEFKLSFESAIFKQATIGNRTTRATGPCQFLPVPKVISKVPVISIEKKRDITSMLKYMPEVDRQFYKAMKLVII